ncbi:leucyl aminopeptidase family protein [Castellaniella sp. GW247-6E4]|uniref:leucyl aminopeptidase family protein n=1 Tax=Castellaniella sp. GW247-6E4 TaxID=3140380 RepID=UPI003315841C
MKQPVPPRIGQMGAIVQGQPVVVCVPDGRGPATGIAWLDEPVERLLRDGLLCGKAATLALALRDGQSVPLVAVPLDGDGSPQDVRLRAAEGIALLRTRRQARCTVVLPADGPTAQWVTEGVLAANHSYESAGAARDGRPAPLQIDFVASGGGAGVGQAVHAGWLTSVATLAARDLVTEPANILTPPRFVEYCREKAAQANFDILVMGRAELEDAGMGGLLAVASGSRYEPYLVRMDWRPTGAPAEVSPIVLVGKTVTFDSGGISLKNPQDMDFMKADMGGGAAIFGAMSMIAELKPAFPVTALFAVVENMPDAHAMRPSDVIRMASGATVEIINTDAEGRLILADALHVAAGLNPRVVIDLATLTGATLGTFGPIGTTVFANDTPWFERLARADERAGEMIWRMPLWPQYRQFLESPVADSRHYATTGQNGSTPVAAAFLSQFIGSHPWLHLDIYNTCWNHRANALMPQGPTGSGSRVLAQLILDLAADADLPSSPENIERKSV